MKSYHGSTAPILDYYKKQNLLLSVNAMGKMNTVKSDILNGLYDRANYWKELTCWIKTQMIFKQKSQKYFLKINIYLFKKPPEI